MGKNQKKQLSNNCHGKNEPIQGDFHFTPAEIRKIAEISMLNLTESELEEIPDKLTTVVKYADVLYKIDVKDVKPTCHATSIENVTAEDIVEPSLTQEEALKNAKASKNGYFKIKRVM